MRKLILFILILISSLSYSQKYIVDKMLESRHQKMSACGIELLIRLEGLRLDSYRDAGGVCTISVGSVIDDKNGCDVSIDMDEAAELFDKDLIRFEKAVSEEFNCLHLPQHEFDALVIFSYNVGRGGFNKSTALKMIKSKATDKEIIYWWKKWVYVKGKKNKGLINRRNKEINLYFLGEYD